MVELAEIKSCLAKIFFQVDAHQEGIDANNLKKMVCTGNHFTDELYRGALDLAERATLIREDNGTYFPTDLLQENLPGYGLRRIK